MNKLADYSSKRRLLSLLAVICLFSLVLITGKESLLAQQHTSCTVGLDPGHGGPDPGAIRANVREADIVWDVAQRTRDILESQGYQVVFSRGQNENPGFSERVITMRQGGADFIVSIHANASCHPGPPPNCYEDITNRLVGTEALYQDSSINPQAVESKRLAELLAESVASHAGLPKRSEKTGGALYASDMPSALIELAFINSVVEREMMVNQPDIFARGVAEAIFTYGSSRCGPPQAPPAPPPPPLPSTSSSTVLVFDTSGSMRGSKLNDAKLAGRNIVDVIAAENEAFLDVQNRVALVEFNTRSRVISELTADLQALRTDLQRLNADGWTAMADGLRTAVDMLDADSSPSTPIIILLSDGIPNVPLGGTASLLSSDAMIRQEILDIATEAGGKGYCIYTVGFGRANELDEVLLQQIPQLAGCGDYYHTTESDELTNIYITLRHTSVGEVRLQQSGTIAQGEQVTIGTIDVPVNQGLLLYTLNWPGSQLNPVLTDPRGQQVTTSYPGATFSQQSSIATVIVEDPLSGNWSVAADGVDVPGNNTTYNAIVSTRLASERAATNDFLPLWLLLGGLFLVTAVMYNRTQTGTGWSLEVSEPGLPTQHIKVKRSGVWIGRSRNCQVRVSDPMASSRHCWVGPSTSRGTLYVRDNNSKNGIRRNGDPILNGGLSENDVLTVGEVKIRALYQAR